MGADRVASELTVAILPMGNVSPRQVELTVLVLENEFGVKTMILPAIAIPPKYFNAERGRYNSYDVLRLLFTYLPLEAQRIVGVVEGELELDDVSTCLACAHPYNRVAIYSASPLSEWKRLSVKDQSTKDLISHIVLTHEFGHTLGLSHCEQISCVMHQGPCYTEMCAACRRWADRELNVKPGSAEERFTFAECLFTYSCYTEAIKVYFQARLLAPYEPLYYSRLARALFRIGLVELANRQFRLAATFAKDSEDMYYGFGLANLNVDTGEAEEYFDKAIATAEDVRFMHKLIGQAYREILHDVERASRHYLEYLRLGGDDQDVVDWLVSRSKLEKK